MNKVEIDFWDFLLMKPTLTAPLYVKLIIANDEGDDKKHVFVRLEERDMLFTTELNDIDREVPMESVSQLYDILHLNNYYSVDSFYWYDDKDEFERDKALEAICDN